jgi:hypothetical protein
MAGLAEGDTRLELEKFQHLHRKPRGPLRRRTRWLTLTRLLIIILPDNPIASLDVVDVRSELTARPRRTRLK